MIYYYSIGTEICMKCAACMGADTGQPQECVGHEFSHSGYLLGVGEGGMRNGTFTAI